MSDTEQTRHVDGTPPERARRGSAPRLETGIPGFDEITYGGVPKGRATLVVGTSGTGKTVFGLQFLAAGARDAGETGVLVTFEEVPEDLVNNAESFGWDLTNLIADEKLVVIDASPEPHEADSFDFDDLLA